MDVLFNDTAKVSTESEAQAPQADSYSTTTRLTVSNQNDSGSPNYWKPDPGLGASFGAF